MALLNLSITHLDWGKQREKFFPVPSATTELPSANFTSWLCYSQFPKHVCECLNLNKQEAMTVLGTIGCCELRLREKFGGSRMWESLLIFLAARLANEDYPVAVVSGGTNISWLLCLNTS